MKTIYSLLTTMCLIFYATMANAQSGSVKGVVKDAQGEFVPYANVALYKAQDSSLVTGSITNENGAFTIRTESGTYYLKISAIGFGTFQSGSFTMESAGEKNFGDISLQDDVQVMDAVEVKALRPMVRMEADKMVVSVEGTALAAGTTAYEVLEKSPGVFVDQDGNIQLNGRGGVRIMIDGRPTYLSMADLQNMLQGMSADNIKDIEIISNPSAKYDAEGNAGIINIQLKKNTIQGLNGSISGGYQYNGLSGYNGSLTINYKKDKWNTFFNGDIARRTRIRTSEMYREFNRATESSIFDQEGREEVIRVAPSIRFGTDYDITPSQTIGVLFNVSGQDGSNDFNTTSELTNTSNPVDTLIQAHNFTNYQFVNGMANLHYSNKLDTLGTKLSADISYVRLKNEGGSDFRNTYSSLESGQQFYTELLQSDNPTSYDIYSAQVDFEKKLFGKGKLETGIKASSVTSDNDLNFFIVEGSEQVEDETRSNHFVYTEEILAAYASYSTPIGEKLSLKAGLRGEQTFSEGESLTTGQVTPRDYFNLFPSLFLQHRIAKNYQVNYNYSRRIDRPRYDNLNPFIFYLDPKSWAQGNPYLRPQLTHSFQVTQTIMQKFNLILSYSNTKNFIAEVPVQNNEDNTTVFSMSNVDDSDNFSATAVLPFQPVKWWSMNNSATVAHQEFTTMLSGNVVDNAQTSWFLRSGNTFMLPADFRLELNVDARSPIVHGLYRIEGNWGMDLGIKKSFNQKKWEVAVNVSDIFRTRQIIGAANFEGNINSFDQYFSAQSVGFSLRYRFSKGEKFEGRNRNVNLDELNRAGG